MQLRTTAPNGLLAWSAGRGGASAADAGDSDYIALAVADGFPELSFRLGKDSAVTTIKARVRLSVAGKISV